MGRDVWIRRTKRKQMKNKSTHTHTQLTEKYQTIYIQGKEVNTVKTFKYLGSLFDANGGVEKDINN